MKSDFSSFGVDVKVGKGGLLDRSITFDGNGIIEDGDYVWGRAIYFWGKVHTNLIVSNISHLQPGQTKTRRTTSREVGTAIGNIASHEAAHTFGAKHVGGTGVIMEENPPLSVKPLNWSASTMNFFRRRFAN